MTDILFPVGRFVGGSMYEGKTKDDKGQPLTFSDGSPRTSYSFGVAIPKAGEQHWNATAWGRIIWDIGAKGSPATHQGQHFAWKITDGDSQLPNKKGNKPCDNEGWPGHWVVWFSGNYAPSIVNADGSAAITEPGAVKPGYYVQVFGNVAFNNRTDSPGVYLNYTHTALSAYGPEIKLSSAPAANTVGFGQGVALPPGASATPVTQMAPPAAAGAPVTAPAPTAAPSAPAAPNTSYMAPPPPVQKPFPPAGWVQHPDNPAYWYMGDECITEAELRAR